MPQAHGAASIAQVHRAKLQDGTPVVLKVRRPGVREKIDADLRLLRRVSELIESEIPEARRYRPAEIAEQFAKSLEREADFAVETRNIERFAKNFAGDPHIVIPRIYPEYTSDVLLVQEHVDGIPATDLAAVEQAGLDQQAARGARRRRLPEDDPARRLLPRRPAPGQRVLPARQPHRDHRLRHGRAALAAAPRAGDRPARRPRAHGGGADAGGAARLGGRRLRRRGEARHRRERDGVRLRGRAAQGHPRRQRDPPVRRHRARALDRAALGPVAHVQGAHHARGPGPAVRPRLPHHRPPHAAGEAARSPSATSRRARAPRRAARWTSS